jgi:hypothetical protein
MSPNLDLKQGISYLERGREGGERDRETADNKNPKQSWVAQQVIDK